MASAAEGGGRQAEEHEASATPSIPSCARALPVPSPTIVLSPECDGPSDKGSDVCYQTRSITSHGLVFQFQPFQSKGTATDPPEWVVSQGWEFIGVMPCSLKGTTKEFDVRCSHWLTELLGRTESRTAKGKPRLLGAPQR
jgi:hypothetical protein